mgnify:CR=1 FL=1
MISISTDLTLKPIKIEDHPILFTLMQKVYKTAYQDFWTDKGEWYLDLSYNEGNLKKELARDRSNYFFVVFEEKLVGILKYDFPFSPREVEIPNAMKLHRLYLDQSVHGKGIAIDLMLYIEAIAKKNSLDFIWLETMAEKPQAKRFYEKMGYERVFTYELDFERLHPEVTEIHIMKKKI